MHTQFITGKRFSGRKQTRLQDQLETAKIAAKIDADMSALPQTVWLTNDKDAPFMSLANGSNFKSELRPKPVVTLLPENYFD
jgi:hypothetical protein